MTPFESSESFRVKCPSCKKSIRAQKSMRGRIAKCPRCGGEFRIPLRTTAKPPQKEPIKKSLATANERPSGSQQATTTQRKIWIAAWTAVGLFAVSSLFYCIWYARSQHAANVAAADLRVSQAVADAQQWMAGEEDLAKWKVIESSLLEAISHQHVSDKHEGQTVLELCRQHAQSLQLWNDARERIKQRRGREAAILLERLVAGERIEHRAESQWILEELMIANSDAEAMKTLLGVDEASFLETGKSGTISDPRVTRPELQDILNDTVQRNLPMARTKWIKPKPPEPPAPLALPQQLAKKLVFNSIGMKLVLIPKGTFMMGSPEGEVGRSENEIRHEVTISQDYYLGMYEVTQDQYEKVMGENPSFFAIENFEENISNHPVEMVSWNDAFEFCKRLSELPEEKAAGRVYRLPTEAEWEYACRAGSKTAYSFGDDPDELDEDEWNNGDSGRKPHVVGKGDSNAWDLYDMHGNVWEWCADWYGEYPEGAVTDPVGPSAGVFRVCRGGSFSSGAAGCRSARRASGSPSGRGRGLGFRVALSSSRIPQ